MTTIKTRAVWMAGVLALAGAVGLLQMGCETASNSDREIQVGTKTVVIDREGIAHETFTSQIVLTNGFSEIVELAAGASSGNQSLILPLEWTVSASALGVIQSSDGRKAYYLSTGYPGNNTIMVRDQANATGIAVVEHR